MVLDSGIPTGSIATTGYERFCRDIKEIYDKDNFDAVRNNATYNNKVKADLVFLAEAVDNEDFIRRVFSAPVLPFEKFEELETEMNIQSTNVSSPLRFLRKTPDASAHSNAPAPPMPASRIPRMWNFWGDGCYKTINK